MYILYIYDIIHILNHVYPHLSNVDHMMVERHGLPLGRSDSFDPGRWDSQRIEEDPGGKMPTA
jgi:hypothetical protein